MNRRMRALVAVALLAGLVVGESAAIPAAASTQIGGGRSLAGTINGAEFRIEVPKRWNGTLVLYSHGLYFPGAPSFPPVLTNRPPGGSETEKWLLDHGYALAASAFQGRTGYLVEQGMRDQMALLDWFQANVGRPRRTVATGQSMGSSIAIQLAERHPDRFAGVVAFCGTHDLNETFNRGLDVTFAIKTLLAAPGQDIQLVRAADPLASSEALRQAVAAAQQTTAGRARLALVASLGNITGWYDPYVPRPTNMADRIDDQATWMQFAYSYGFGPFGRADLEPRLGGNPSSNIGIDYRHQLARSGQVALVREAYQAAPEVDLQHDLNALAAAPRIAPDPAALANAYRVLVPRGTTPVPVVTLHSTGDSGAVPDQERWYASQVRRFGDPDKLRQLYVDRGQHCSFSAAEEIVAMQALFARIENGRWTDLDPRRLNQAARALGGGYHNVFDLGSIEPPQRDLPRPPAFTTYTPRPALRPSR